ncbi:hypothetical protein [Alicyclobacillus acidocaldarius]|uniref:hypothetical protein n=1 Tax=Alicyclobacillus acidocaldarius TaxID=405212 RepID=UPI001305266C|nr:hypothetical protein [Alicyclobacillus acidocaldarius]
MESVDPGGALLLGLLTMRDDTGYSVPPTPSPLILQVPVVRVTQGGYESDRRVSMTLSHTAPITRQAPLFSLQSEATGENALGRPLFVSYDTYRRILETAYQRPYAALVRAFTQGQDLGIQPVENVAVYVPHVADVDRVARALAGRGYGECKMNCVNSPSPNAGVYMGSERAWMFYPRSKSVNSFETAS